MTAPKRRIQLPPKRHNQWGGLLVEEPGGMARDNTWIDNKSRRAAEQMRATAARQKGVRQ